MISSKNPHCRFPHYLQNNFIISTKNYFIHNYYSICHYYLIILPILIPILISVSIYKFNPNLFIRSL